MENKTIIKTFFTFIIIAGIYSCREKKETEVQVYTNEISIFNYDNKHDLLEYNKLKLDESHPNLLNPNVSKSDYNLVKKSWISLHQNIGEYLSDNEFKWGVKDSSITIFHKNLLQF